MKEIYNEGRVVGLSSWEIYVRHMLAQNPTATPLNEQEWLSASLSPNVSMVLRIPEGTERGIHDYKLPADSDICACNLICGYLFDGEVALDDRGMWGVRVEDYGRLVRNDPDVHPESPGEPEDIPTKDNPIDVPDAFIEKCKEFLKISSGLIFQPGEWIDSVYYTNVLTQSEQKIVTQRNDYLLAPMRNIFAAKMLEPDMAKTGFIRLAITGDITTDILLYLRGFSYKGVVSGEVGYAYVPDLGKPEDGGFLGPATFPWASPIQFIITTEVMSALIDGSYPPIVPPVPDWVNQWNPSWADVDIEPLLEGNQ